MPPTATLEEVLGPSRNWILGKIYRGSSDPIWVLRRVKRYGGRAYKYKKATKHEKQKITKTDLKKLIEKRKAKMQKQAKFDFSSSASALKKLYDGAKNFMMKPAVGFVGGTAAGLYAGNQMYQGQVRQTRNQAIMQRYNELMGYNQDPNQGQS